MVILMELTDFRQCLNFQNRLFEDIQKVFMKNISIIEEFFEVELEAEQTDIQQQFGIQPLFAQELFDEIKNGTYGIQYILADYDETYATIEIMFLDAEKFGPAFSMSVPTEETTPHAVQALVDDFRLGVMGYIENGYSSFQEAEESYV